jgi:hypothetical protein
LDAAWKGNVEMEKERKRATGGEEVLLQESVTSDSRALLNEHPNSQ